MLLFWLIVAGLVTELPGAIALLVLPLLVVAFIALHVLARRPTTIELSRLSPPSIKVLVQFGIPISLLLVTGDILWLIAGDRLNPDSDPLPLATILAFVTLFPLVEEFGFRLWVQTPLERKLGGGFSVFLVALLFALFHDASFPLPQLIAGLGFGVALITTGSIWVPVVMHVFQNMLLVFLGGIPVVQSWAVSLAENEANWVPVASAACWGGALLFLVTWYRFHRTKPVQTSS